MNYLDSAAVKSLYASMPQRFEQARQHLGRALTLTEKILIAHLEGWSGEPLTSGQSHVLLRPDRVAMQDATAQMALLQFMQARLHKVAVPTTVHCDHLIQARVGADQDLRAALLDNDEVYNFLRTASNRHGIGFWKPGAGIIHQVILENYAFPGGMLIGTDSHTPNAGGLGMLAVGVGGADTVDVMAGEPWLLRWPALIGVKLTGSLTGWASPKDVILHLAGILTVSGGTGSVIEYFGPGVTSISCTGKATIANMGAELGATTSIFPFDERMSAYLKATRRQAVACLAEEYSSCLIADPEVEREPQRYFDRIVEIDLNTLEPYVVGPHSPDLARTVSKLAAEVVEKGYPEQLKVALIGSCTNSSYEDMSRAAAVAEQGAEHGLKAKCKFMITPGSEQINQTIRRDGQLAALERMGGVVLANACGPCIGQWKREDISPGEENAIISSFNRNFSRRNDGNAQTLAFIGSPELVTAMAFAGKLTFNPLADSLQTEDGRSIKLMPPICEELPQQGFVNEDSGYIAPGQDTHIAVSVSHDSERLQLLEPFAPWDGQDFIELPVLLKAAGKCTTDHISPAGPWLRFRGHLDKISDNMFISANNVFAHDPGHGLDIITGECKPLPEIARHYKTLKKGWAVIGDQNYGEGSSREHAAMSPRFLGCKVVLVRSFARIHETNLKKQGILALTFSNPDDYELVGERDRLSIVGLAQLAAGQPLQGIVHRTDGSCASVEVKHSMTAEQIKWFKAGSALNLICQQL